MTTAVRAFSAGHIGTAFYTQPAAGLLCVLLIAAGVVSLVVAATGRDFGIIGRLRRLSGMYVIIATIVIILAAWAVTLVRAVTD
jgi:hypothetical protein